MAQELLLLLHVPLFGPTTKRHKATKVDSIHEMLSVECIWNLIAFSFKCKHNNDNELKSFLCVAICYLQCWPEYYQNRLKYRNGDQNGQWMRANWPNIMFQVYFHPNTIILFVFTSHTRKICDHQLVVI